MKYVYALYGGPSGVSPTLFGLYTTLAAARRNRPDMEGDEHVLEELFIVKLPVGSPIDHASLQYFPFVKGGDRFV